ncbi:MAG TPA: TetR/AcrR family transcriptional regulator [Solirubrobacterales bacterium]|nr:TetR/AcrR family transcriptional regulator [Solirubrobacterales bacterium]
MTRLPKARETNLTPEEIVDEALRQFDEGAGEPTIRSLAAALKTAPSSIYHHFPSRAAIIQRAVECVWREATENLLELLPRPLEAEPREVLVATGLASRRAWLSHFRLCPYMAASPEGDDFTREALGAMAVIFESMELEGDAAAEAFYAYGTFMLGSILFAATRLVANEQLAEREQGAFRTEHTAQMARRSEETTRLSLDHVMGVSVTDPDEDEALFVNALRNLVDGLEEKA